MLQCILSTIQKFLTFWNLKGIRVSGNLSWIAHWNHQKCQYSLFVPLLAVGCDHTILRCMTLSHLTESSFRIRIAYFWIHQGCTEYLSVCVHVHACVRVCVVCYLCSSWWETKWISKARHTTPSRLTCEKGRCSTCKAMADMHEHMHFHMYTHIHTCKVMHTWICTMHMWPGTPLQVD